MFVSGENVEKLHCQDFCIFTFMKRMLILFVLCLAGSSYAQTEIKLKKKYYGDYEGIIPEYRVMSDDELMFVNEAIIGISIKEDSIFLNIGNNELNGTYSVMFQADKYYLLDVTIEDQLANERIMVYKRGKELTRDGMFPQPLSRLAKVKRKKKKKKKD